MKSQEMEDFLGKLSQLTEEIESLKLQTSGDTDSPDATLAVEWDGYDDFDMDNDLLVLPDLTRSTSISSLENEGSEDWLRDRCRELTTLGSSLSFSETDLYDILLQILKSDSSDDDIQESLVDILGFDNLGLVSEMIPRRSALVSHSQATEQGEPTGPFLTDAERRKLGNANWNEMQDKASRLLADSDSDPKYPHVFRSHDAGSTLSAYGTKYALPMGSTRSQYELHEEVIIPYPKKSGHKSYFTDRNLVGIEDLDGLCKGTFSKYKTLNRMQSLVFPVGYNTNDNMLVCAPTGAGKTDVALLAMLNTIRQHADIIEEEEGPGADYNIRYDEFKIIYVAPLKALAAEIVEKMGSRLAWLGISVRELTGDMQLTRAEIASTQVIVTTPEKWDVVSRKSTGDNELVTKVKLLIIDEVHLLNEDRGAVIESLVARTLRQVESTQSMIRIVGLSATLPNFIDVAEFLRVNLQVGMFYFDASFRPVPLKQIFAGAKGKAGSRQAMENIDRVSYEKLVENLNEGHQVMVFVHSRKDTVKSARTFMSMAQKEGDMDLFDCTESSYHDQYQREMSKYKNKDMKELFDRGFGIHHAGMLRSERNMTEKMFLNGAIKVLCCTATLAWGVNLPAAVVIIKGTQVYDAKRGGFVDLGISDVIQIFGRAGRPQFEKYGTGILCTSLDRLDHYLSAITQQHPLESKLQPKLADNLNAEIALGTVTNVDEGVQWLGYTFMFVRMRKNPLAYGIKWDDVVDDPLLGQRRRQLIVESARRLNSIQMIIFDENKTDSFVAKDIGRIASDFYLLNNSVEVFNTLLKPTATEADILAMLSMSGEFDGIKLRPEEVDELEQLKDKSAPCQIAGGLDSAEGKTNILIQAYISKALIKDSALSSDAMYVAQNATRIVRALFLICVNRRWGRLARLMLSLCKSIEHRQWSFQHPLSQFELPLPVLRNLEARSAHMEDLKDMEASELGDLVHNARYGSVVARLIDRFPLISINHAEIMPITAKVLRVHIELEADFKWDFKVHGPTQMFWIWVEEDSEKHEILHFDKLMLSRSRMDTPHVLDFTIPLQDPLPTQLIIRATSDRWLGSETSLPVSFNHLIRPETNPIQTKLLKLRPLPVAALNDALLEEIYGRKFEFFNPMQTMVFHTLYHTDTSVLLGSPTGSGKTVACELAMWAAFRKYPGSKVVYIAPMKALVKERVGDWSKGICKQAGLKLVELTGDTNPKADSIRKADIIIATPEKFDGISRNWQTRKFVQQVSLIIMDEIHLLASDRGPILEMIVSRMNFVTSRTSKPVRLLGMSTAVANAQDMASWLGVKDNSGLFNFSSSVRPVPLQMYIDGFPDNMGFCPLMKTMNKPAFLAIKRHSPTKPVLIFVASRRQTRITAQDLIHMCGMEDNPRRFLKMSDDELAQVLSRVRDDTLKLALQFGIALHHAGLVDSDRQISHELFANNKVQILVATSTLAWGVNLPAYLVIIKGTQFYDAKVGGYRDMDLTDVLQMMGRAGRPAYDTSGVAIVYTKQSTKAFYKHFLNTGFPVESSLHKVFEDHLGAEISAGTISSKQQALDFLTWTFLYRRIHNNPTYYGIEAMDAEHINEWAVQLIDKTISNLYESGCVVEKEGGEVLATKFLKISSFYYMSHKTMKRFLESIVLKTSQQICLQLLALAAEYNELAFRHNEDLINEELSLKVRYHGQDLKLHMVDPHVKAYLLVQAHMTRIQLPIEDYEQDTIAVLDQSLRILQAAVDTCAELGYLSSCLEFISLMRGIKQGCWEDDDAVTCLPGLTLAKKSGGLSLHEVGVDPNGACNKLRIPGRFQRDFKRVASELPVLSVRLDRSSEKPGPVTVGLKHINGKTRIYTPRFHKPQSESWFVIVAVGDELVSLQRVSPSAGRETTITVETRPGGTLLVVSDALDLDYRLPL